jgi:hypothetical protein
MNYRHFVDTGHSQSRKKFNVWRKYVEMLNGHLRPKFIALTEHEENITVTEENIVFTPRTWQPSLLQNSKNLMSLSAS